MTARRQTGVETGSSLIRTPLAAVCMSDSDFFFIEMSFYTIARFTRSFNAECLRNGIGSELPEKSRLFNMLGDNLRSNHRRPMLQ
jgi:hypothetical protein